MAEISDEYLARKLTSVEKKLLTPEEKRERQLARNRVSYQKNKEKILKQKKKYKEKNKEKLKEKK